LMRSSITMAAVGPSSARSLWVAFRQGAITCLLNPKAYLFVFAVYPQFMKPQYGGLAMQAIVMGILTALTQSAIYGALALAAAKSRDLLAASPHAILWVGRAVGVLFVLLAAAAVWHGWTAAPSSQQ
jgi:threonine/homoserine/homoserine lactone efflux protein